VILQSTQYTCGPCSIVNALEALGQELTERAASTLSSACPVNGTSKRQLAKALRDLGWEVSRIQHPDDHYDEAWLSLVHHLSAGSPVVALVDRDEHWVAAIGVLGSGEHARIQVADSALGELVLSYSKDSWAKRWLGQRRRTRYYGLAVGYGLA